MSDEVLENPVTGERMVVLVSTPECFKFKYSIRPHGSIAAEHFHPHMIQLMTVLSGEMHVRVGRKESVMRAGESATVPAGARHFQWNTCDVEVRAIEEYRPAGRLHDFFKVLFGLAKDGKLNARGFPPPMLGLAVFWQFKDSTQPASIGLRFISAILGLRVISAIVGPWLEGRKYHYDFKKYLD
jgi:mannose-6-phosphate isomerase-like protein (cupin superfamily)